ncbi:MAG: Ig-like domain-containing protein [Pirellula sp.]
MPSNHSSRSARCARRRLLVEALESRSMMAADFYVGMRHNLLNPADVNMDGRASPIDALMVIDELNRSDRSADGQNRMMADTNNDGFVSPVDALVVIDTLNSDFIRNMPNLNPGGSGGSSGEDTQDEVTAVDDSQLVYVPADATEKPEIEIDVLMNDIGQGLSIVEVGMAATGTVSIRPSSTNPENTVLVYTPNTSSANYDRFLYMIESADGRRSTAFASIKYEVKQDDTINFELVMPDEVEGTAGQEINFRGSDSAPLIQFQYSGFSGAQVGVYLSWEFAEGFSVGQRFVGELLSRSSTSMATFYPIGGGGAWIVGDIAGVNRILANLYYNPADGYSSTAGIRLNGVAFLYTSIGVNYGNVSDSTLVKVTKQPSDFYPDAVDDYFKSVSRSQPTTLDILANDRFKGFATRRNDLSVEITPWEHSDATITWDPVLRKVTYEPGFIGAYGLRPGDQFAYTIRTPDGQASQGIVTVIHEGAL